MTDETVAGRAARLLEEAAWSRDLDAERDEEGELFGDAEDARAHAREMRKTAVALRAAEAERDRAREEERAAIVAWLRDEESCSPDPAVTLEHAHAIERGDHLVARTRNDGGAED